MASRKRISLEVEEERVAETSGLRKGFESMQASLEKIKSDLNTLHDARGDNGERVNVLTDELRRLAGLAERFLEQRTRSAKTKVSDLSERDRELSDVLDAEGVHLWNLSAVSRKLPEGNSLRLVGALRLAAFRLVEAGMEAKPAIESLLHILQLASKTGASLANSGSNELAGAVLTSAAKYEEALRRASDPEGAHRTAKACASVVYFSSRMDAAWKEGNHTVAEFMAQKITEDEARLGLLPAHDRVLLASKLHVIGKGMMKGSKTKSAGEGDSERDEAAAALGWQQKAFGIVDQMEDGLMSAATGAAPGVRQLKISILRALARTYFMSGELDRAEAALEEILPSIDASDSSRFEYQDLRWLRLAVLKRRNAGDAVILEAYKNIVDHMQFNESSLTDILQDLRTLVHQSGVVTSVHQHCLQQALELRVPDTDGGGGTDYVERLLLSLVVHSSKDQEHARSIDAIGRAFTLICEAEYALGKVPSTACLSLLWQYGDRKYRAKGWADAADWFLLGTHALFRKSAAATSMAKCYRKAALCYIEQREYSRASTILRQCDLKEAATHYVMFLAAVKQGLEDEALSAVKEMVNAPEFERGMLLLATQVSHESGMHTVLMRVLELLLATLVGPETRNGETVVEAMTLLRCIIRLGQKLLTDPMSNRVIIIDAVLSHFRTANELVEEAYAQKATSLIMKDIAWLWRSAYNFAVQGCAEWEDASYSQISALFDVASNLLEAYRRASPVDLDPDILFHHITASFCGISGRIFAARQFAVETDVNHNILHNIIDEIRRCQGLISQVQPDSRYANGNDTAKLEFFRHTLRVYETELLVRLRLWEDVTVIVKELVASGPMALDTSEAIADILWADNDCPIEVLYTGLESILRASLSHASLSIEKFSRWLRALSTIILARNSSADRQKAIGYFDQAITVMEEHAGSNEDAYPVDECSWLFATAYKTGIECSESSALDEAKRWFEVATVLSKFIPGGQEKASRVSETYQDLLARYSTT